MASRPMYPIIALAALCCLPLLTGRTVSIAASPRTTARASTRPATAPATQPVAAEVAARAARLPGTWAGASYEYGRAGRVLGRISHRNEPAKLDGRDVLKLTDVLELEAPGRTVRVTYTTLCEPDAYLTPIRVTAQGEGGGEMGEMDVRVDGRQALGMLRGKPVAVNLPGPVVTELALFRLVTLMPRREGAELHFHGLQSTEMLLQGEQVLRCAGKERVRVAGKEYIAWKYEHSGDGVIKSSTYWVNADGFFLKALLDGYKEWTYAPKK